MLLGRTDAMLLGRTDAELVSGCVALLFECRVPDGGWAVPADRGEAPTSYAPGPSRSVASAVSTGIRGQGAGFCCAPTAPCVLPLIGARVAALTVGGQE